MILTFIKKAPFKKNIEHLEYLGPVGKGPGDEQIQVYDQLQLTPYSEKRFLKGQLGKGYGQKDLDLVHTYTVVRMVLNMYQDHLGRKLSWPGPSPLYIYPFSGSGVGACFIPEENSIYCYSNAVKKKWVFSCRFFDVVAHETGHAILNALKPEWTISTTKETAAVVESICDLTALFTKLNNWEWFNEIQLNDQLKGLSCFAFDYGLQLGYPYGIRNFNSSNHGVTSHDISTTFSGAVFQSLIWLYTNQPNLTNKEKYNKTQQIVSICLVAIDQAKGNNIDFGQLANNMLSIATENSWDDWVAGLRVQFHQKKIISN